MGRLRDFFSFEDKAELATSLAQPFVLPELGSANFSSEVDTPTSIDDYFRRLNADEGIAPRIGRTAALSIPAVLRGRNLICSTIAGFPLVTYRGDNEVIPNGLLQQIDPFGVSNLKTLADILEDLLFEEVSYLRVYSRYNTGYPAKAYHLEVKSVMAQAPTDARPTMLTSGVHPESEYYVDGVLVPRQDIIRFDSPNPGFLKTVGRVVRSAIQASLTSQMYLNNPMPKGVFTPKAELGSDPFEDEDEVREQVQKFGEDRNDSPYAYIGYALDFNPFDNLSPSDLQLVEIDKAVTLGIANAMGLDPAMLGLNTQTETYANANDKRKDRMNDLLSPYMRAIEQTLSCADLPQPVTPRGYFVKFDPGDYFQPDPKTRWENYQIASSIKAMTVDEIRAREGLPPLTAAQKRELNPPVPEPTDQSPLRVQAHLGQPVKEIQQ